MGSKSEDRIERGVSRRDFLRAGAVTAAAAAIGGYLQFLPALTEAGSRRAEREVWEAIRTSCGLCVNKCGVIARVHDGVVRKLDPIPDHPKSRGMLCARGNSGVQALYDPNRLKYPLIRKGPRGSGEWKRASWEEALDHVAENLDRVRQEKGPQAVMFSSTEGFQEHFFLQLAHAFGSPNVARHPTLCLASMIHGMFNTFGQVPDFDLRETRYVILAGANRFEALVTPDSVDMMRSIGGAQKLVVLDPRFTISASKADEWLPIRPGTDLAFVLALMNVIFEEGLQDQDFIDRYTIGGEELREHVRAHTPEWAERETQIPAATIRRVAREFAAAAPRAVFYPGRRSSWNTNDTQFRRGIACLNAIVGAWDRPGGCLPKASISIGEPDVFPPDDVHVARCDDLERIFPLANKNDGSYLSMRDAVLAAKESPIDAWMIYKQNPVHSVPDANKTLKMMERIGFVVTIETAATDTAWMSDVILPESMYLERTDPPHSISGAVPVVLSRPQVVAPRHDTKPNLEIMQGLAERLDLAEYFDYRIEDWVEAAVRPLPISREEFVRQGYYTDREQPVIGRTLEEGYRFRTKTGKIELRSERYAENGYAPLPTYRRPPSLEPGRYRLLTGRSALYTHASLQGLSWLANADAEGPGAWIHTKVAARHGVRQGDLVEIRSPHGRIQCPVNVSERIREDCVYVPHGFGSHSTGMSAHARKGGRDTDLIGDQRDEISGNAAMHETAVEILPIAGGSARHPRPVCTRTEGVPA